MASTIVGFSPAATTTVTTGATATAPHGEDGETNLFAMLLSLIGLPATPASETVATAEALPSPAPLTFSVPAPVPVIDTAAASVPEPAPEPVATVPTDPLLAQAVATETGKSLLKDLGDALIALSDALESGQPVDPALEKKLNGSLDAVAAYLGTFAPPPAIDPRLAAFASGEHVLPTSAPAALAPPPPAAEGEQAQPGREVDLALDATLPAIPAVSAATIVPTSDAPVVTSPEVTATPAPTNSDVIIGETAETDPAQAAPVANHAPPVAAALPAEIIELFTDLGVDLPAPIADPPQPEANTAAAATPATTHEPLPPALHALGGVIGKLGERLERQDPALAKKLDDLAASLKSGTAPEELTTALGLDAADAEPEVLRIVQALVAPKPVPVAAAAPQPFIAAHLALPDDILTPDPATPATDAPAPMAGNSDRAPALRPEPLAPITPELTLARPPSVEVSTDTQVAPEAKAEPKPTFVAAQPQPATPAAAPIAAANTPTAPPVEALVPVARVHAAYLAPIQQVNVPQVAFEIARQFEAGSSRFQIRLDPADLGRIDVSLEVEKSGTINARMVVERPETLDLMQRDQRALQQALQQAGLDANKTNLEFSLRQNPFAQQGGAGDGQNGQPRFGDGGDAAQAAASEPASAVTSLYRGTASAGGVNLFV